MGDATPSDEEIAASFRAWIDLPADATPEQMWAARPARVAVHRRLRAEPDPINFIDTLLRSATDAHGLAIICETIKDLVWQDHPETLQTVFDRSGDEPWATLSLHVFGTDEIEGVPDSQINRAQAVEAHVWMGGELEPGETHEDRYCHGITGTLLYDLHDRDEDPVPLLALLRRTAQTEFEEDYVLTGAFESVCYDRPDQRARVAAIAPAAWADFLRTL